MCTHIYEHAGDKTRMDLLSRSDSSYVRASPTRGVLGIDIQMHIRVYI